MKAGHIEIITTGGTIDKIYFDAKSTYSIGDPQIGEVLRQAHVTTEYKINSLMRKDSLEMTNEDREMVRQTIVSSPAKCFIVTHGTDTMTETGAWLRGIEGKVIVLTGALLPARFKDNDALFNIGFALGVVQALGEGVYIAMNGEIYEPHKVKKDRELNRFVRVS